MLGNRSLAVVPDVQGERSRRDDSNFLIRLDLS